MKSIDVYYLEDQKLEVKVSCYEKYIVDGLNIHAQLNGETIYCYDLYDIDTWDYIDTPKEFEDIQQKNFVQAVQYVIDNLNDVDKDLSPHSPYDCLIEKYLKSRKVKI